ncbi:hypothetical protein DV735_g81, partial [Chaetothyriales sp. CBS 134920]
MCSHPLPPLPKKAQAQQGDARQLGCTHQKMTRLYDQYGATPCSVCHRDPDFGWLYRCTQDTDGSLPRSDFSDEAPVKAITSPSSAGGMYLSPAALEAISSGQGNHEQDLEAVQQNDNEDHTRPTTRSSATEESITFSSIPQSTTFSTTATEESITFSSIPQSTTFSTTATSANFDEDADHDWEEDGSRLVRGHEERAEHPVSVCGFRICHACRPTYRDRAMQSIASVLNNPKVAPHWELDNRRVSDARVLRTIGLPKPQPFNTETVQIPVISHAGPEQELEDQKQETINNNCSHSHTGFHEMHYDQLCYHDNQTRPETLEPQF